MSSDSDIAVTFKLFKEAKKEKKESNKEWSTNYLAEQGIAFQSKNDGLHLVVDSSKGKVDFWPSTGLFIRRCDKKEGRGIRRLLKLLK